MITGKDDAEIGSGWHVTEHWRGKPCEYRCGARTNMKSAAVWEQGGGWVAVVRGMILRGEKGRMRIFREAAAAMKAVEEELKSN